MKHGIAFVLRYIARHMRRAAGKSALSVLLAAMLLCAAGQLASVRVSYGDVFYSTPVTAKFSGLSLSQAVRIARLDLALDPYYETTGMVHTNLDYNTYPEIEMVSLVFTNNIARYTGEEAEIRYADGYDETCMDDLANIIIAGNAFLDERGLAPGDKVTLSRTGIFLGVVQQYIERDRYVFKRENPTVYPEAYDDRAAVGEILSRSGDDIMLEVEGQSVICTIAGAVSTPSGEYEAMLFAPGVYSSAKINMPGTMDIAECTVADNDFIEVFRESCEKIMGDGATGAASLYMDTSRIENVRNSIRILDALYPIVVATAWLIGSFLCCLVILQSAKEAATMRVLGTTRASTSLLLSLEQVLLSAAGLAVGAAALLLSRGAALAATARRLSLYAALYISLVVVSAVICSALVTRRSALELLQTRE